MTRSCVKEGSDDEGNDYTVLHMTRRLLDFQGNPNRPTFWKKNKQGTYEVIEPEWIPKHSLVICTASFRSYKVSANMYGTSMDLGKDIIVIHQPSSTHKKKTNVPVNIPFVDY